VGRVIVSPMSSPLPLRRRSGLSWRSEGSLCRLPFRVRSSTVGDAHWQTIAAGLELGSGGTGAESSEENNSSIVGRVQMPGLSLLLTGDVEPEGQEAILAAGDDVRANVVKVPHHGSSRQDPDFLAATGARVALVEVGLNNTYGHPAAKTLRTLEGLGMQILRTD
jgi:competence protein ComEC